jgi:predicted ribonuclease YlaK
VFVSKDINARIKGDALGLVAEDFERRRSTSTGLYTGCAAAGVGHGDRPTLRRNNSAPTASTSRRTARELSSCLLTDEAATRTPR